MDSDRSESLFLLLQQLFDDEWVTDLEAAEIAAAIQYVRAAGIDGINWATAVRENQALISEYVRNQLGRMPHRERYPQPRDFADDSGVDLASLKPDEQGGES